MNCDNIVALQWPGNGGTSAYIFLKHIGLPLGWDTSQFATSPQSVVADGFNSTGPGNYDNLVVIPESVDLDNTWIDIKKYITELDNPPFRGFSGWPYSIFYDQWQRDLDINVKFIHTTRSVEDWAKVEFAYQCMRGVPSEIFLWHSITGYYYGCDLNYATDVASWQTWIDAYKKWHTEVKEYFVGNSNYLYIDIFNTDPLTVANSVCSFIGVENPDQAGWPGPGTVGGERAGLIDSDGWDLKFEERWDSFSTQVTW